MQRIIHMNMDTYASYTTMNSDGYKHMDMDYGYT